MNRCMLSLSIVGCLILGLAGVVRADSDADLRAEIARLQQRLNEVESKQSQNWLNERRAEEIKSLVQDVLADADTRASLMADGAVAGHDGKNFFLASADGSFLLKFSGQIQFRYIANFNADLGASGGGSPPNDDDHEDEGFQMRRVKLAFHGHVEAGGQWEYMVRLAASRDEDSGASYGDGDVFVEDMWVRRQLADGVHLKFGKFKLPFNREELTSSSKQQTVERSSANEAHSLQRAEQIQIQLAPMDNVRALISLSDGAASENTDIGLDSVEFAITARVDVAIQGDLAQTADFSAWSGEPMGIFVGGAVHYQAGDGFNTGNPAAALASGDYLAWTIDGSIETNGLNVFAAVMGNSLDSLAGGTGEVDQLAFVVQGGYFVVADKVEPFLRYEYLDGDDPDGSPATDDDAMLITFGVNIYFEKGHDAKFTADVVWLFDGGRDETLDHSVVDGSPDGRGLGFSENVDEGTLLLRLQFQLLF